MPNAPQDFSTTVTMDHDTQSNKENRAPTPEPPQHEEYSNPHDLSILLTAPTPLEDVQTNTIVSWPEAAPQNRSADSVDMWDSVNVNAASEEENRDPIKTDYRRVEPVTECDKLHIKDALWYTFADAKLRGFEGALQTSPEKSYNDQYNEIQEAFASAWPVADTPVPQLNCLEKWSGSFANYPVLHLSIERFDMLACALPEGAPLWRHRMWV